MDVAVWTDYGHERPIIDQLLATLRPRIESAAEFAIQNRVLLAQEASGVDIDIALAAFPFERELIGRARLQAYPGGAIKICEASDLVIMKAFANRPRDWEDIRGIAIRNGQRLDWNRIEHELAILADLKDEPEILKRCLSFKS